MIIGGLSLAVPNVMLETIFLVHAEFKNLSKLDIDKWMREKEKASVEI